MGAFGYDHRLPGLVSECLPGHAGFSRRNQETSGKPRLVLDWSPSEANEDYDGSHAGTDRNISGVITKVHNRTDSGDGTPTTSLLRCTLSGLKVTHTGGSGQATLLQFDLSSLPGMNVAYRQRCVSMSIEVDAFSNGSTGACNSTLILAQSLYSQPNNDATDMDIGLQARRESASNWRCRSFDYTGSSSKATHNHTSQGLGSSEPASFRQMLWGNSFMWWSAYDTGTGPCRFQGITNDRRIICNNSVTAHATDGLNHNKILWQIGRGDDTAITLTLTNLRVWTY